MTAKPYELLARFKTDGTIAGCHVRTIETINGKDYESEPVPLASATDSAFTSFASAFAAGVVIERDSLATDKAKLTSDLASKTTECDSTKAQYDALVIEKAELIAAHKTALDAKEAALTTANATITALDARIASLLTELPFNPRVIDASAFYARITKDEFAALSVADDETLRTIAKTILAYKTSDWPVVFESPEFQGLIAYLVGTGFLTADRAAELTADATRAEAYNAD